MRITTTRDEHEHLFVGGPDRRLLFEDGQDQRAGTRTVIAVSEAPSASTEVVRQCPTCERCRDCGYTHIGASCPDPNPSFDGTCLCDPR